MPIELLEDGQDNEGRFSDESRSATERILYGPWGWLVWFVAGFIVALAFNGGLLA